MIVPNGYPLKGDLTLDLCRNCAFVSNSTSSTEPDYIEYYKTLNKHQNRDDAHKKIDIEYFSKLISYILENSNFKFLNSKVLDFGSGSLIFSDLAKIAGATTVGNYDIGASNNIDSDYDLILSTHTFEHLVDPKQSFAKLVKILKPGGSIVVAVPDFSTYESAYYGPYAHFDLEHINHFSLSSLSALFESYDMEILSVRQSERRVSPTLSYSEILVIGMKNSKILKKVSPTPNFSAEEKMNSLINRYEIDFAKTIDAFKEILMGVNQQEKVILSIYGLSSQAFRLLSALQDLNMLSEIDFYGDSDSRLTQFSLGDKPIMDKESFYLAAEEFVNNGFKVYVLVYAINSYRIIEMFQKELSPEGLKVIALPPDSQNRRNSY